MKRKRFSEEQIIGFLRKADKGEKNVADLCREHGISEGTYYRWRRKFGGMDIPDANKHEIRQAIEHFFGVKVTDVRTMNVRGKIKRLGRFSGKRADWKKAIVTLAEGDSIDLFDQV